MSLPQVPDRLSDDMAAAIGRAISSFGFLEEALKRAIYSLTRKGLGEMAGADELQEWLKRIEDVADDSMGTLIESFVALLKQMPNVDRQDMAGKLNYIRAQRNFLCHASWRRGKRPGHWDPTFINTRGKSFPGELDAPAINHIHDFTLEAIRQVVSIMRATGIEGELVGDDE